MFILDTNVISELRPARAREPDRNVVAWARSVEQSLLFLSSITILELEIGTLILERRDRRQGAILREWMSAHVLPSFEGKILAVDAAIARRCAALHVPDPMEDRDSLIAATALVHGMTVVTRNVAHFERTGVRVLNPWQH